MKKYRKRIILSTLIIAIVMMIVGIFTGDSSFSLNRISNSSELASTCSPEGEPKTMYVIGNSVNVRLQASASSSSLGQLSKCTTVTTYCKVDDFYRISNSSSKYMSAIYLSETPPLDCSYTYTTTTSKPTYKVGTLQKEPETFYQDNNYYGTVTLTNVQNVGEGEEEKISVTIHNSSGIDVSELFDITKTYLYSDSNYQGQMTIKFSPKSTVAAGKYYLSIDSHRVDFTVARKQLNFSITKSGTDNIPENQEGSWTISLTGTTIPSSLTISDFDYTIVNSSNKNCNANFDVQVQNNNLVIKNKIRTFTFQNNRWIDSNPDYAKRGTYTVNITVKNKEQYEDDVVKNYTQSTKLTITPKVATLEEDKNALEVNRYQLNITRSNYNIAVKGIRFENGAKIYIIENLDEQDTSKKYEEYYEVQLKETYPNLLLNDFNSFFDSVPNINDSNKQTVLLDSSDTKKGYHFAYKSGDIYVYKVKDSNVTYVNSSGTLTTVSEEDFKNEYPTAYNDVALSPKYGKDDQGYIRYLDSGENTKVTKNIKKLEGIYPLAVSGGEYKIKLIFKDYLADELSNFMVSLKNNEGTQYLSYANGGKSINNADFDIDVDLSKMQDSTIYITIIYKSNLSQYAGNYKLDFGFGATDHSSPFTIQDGVFDYVIFSELNQDDSVDENLECQDVGNGVFDCEEAFSNKKYIYYVGFYLKKSNVDIDNIDFALEQMNYKIYDTKASIDENGETVFFNEEDYVLKIVKKTNDNVTFKLSTNGENNFGSDTTLSLDEFKKQYEDAYDMLNVYKYDENGTITGDNLSLQIVSLAEPTGTDTTRKLTYKNGDNNLTINVDDDFKHTHADIYKYIATNRFVFVNDQYQRGVIRGTKRIPASTGHDVTDQFFVKVNRVNEDDNTLDPAKAIVVLPKTEVDPGNYYVYVGYGGLDSVGYEYNYGTKAGESDDDAPIDKELYPEYWEQNIHETSIYYGKPEYDVNVDDPILSNDIDDTLVAYKNAVSHVQIPFVLDYIYDLDKFNYTIEYKNGDTWENADNDFKFNAELNVPDEINNENYKESVNKKSYINLTSIVGTTKEGTYRIKFNYTNKNNVKMKEVVQEFKISGNYFDLKFEKAQDTIFYSNLGKELNFTLDCLSIPSTDNINFQLIYSNTEQPKKNSSFMDFTDESKTLFTYSISDNGESGETKKINFKLKNYVQGKSPQASAGTYTLKASYTGTNQVTVSTSIEFTVIDPEKEITSGNIIPKSNDKEMTIDMVLISHFINYQDLTAESTTYVIKRYNGSTKLYEDVSSSTSSNRLFTTEGTWDHEDGEDKENYSGNLKITLLKDSLDEIYGIYETYPKDPYYIEITVNYKTYELQLPSIKELFDWNIDGHISGSINDENGNPYPVNGIYHNADNISITVDVTTPHEDKFNYLITQSCGQGSECIPNETDVNYKNRFTEQTYTNKQLVLGLAESGRDDNTRLPVGKYQLVLYYNQSDYRIYDFEVRSDFVAIIFNDEISIATKLKDNRYVPELYTNKDAEIEIPVRVIGAEYKDVTISITDPNQSEEYTNKFIIDQDKFRSEHMLDIKYKPADDFAAGEYMIMASKEVEENNVVSDHQNVNFSDKFYNYELTNVSYDPNPAVPNISTGGTITIDVETEDMFINDTMQDGNLKSEIVNSIEVINSDGEAVTNSFTKKYENTSSSDKFKIILNYSDTNTLKPGDYKVKTTCVKDDTIISRSIDIFFDDYDRSLIISGVDTISEAPDSLVHKNIEGTYSIRFTSSYAVETTKLNVKVLDSENQDKTDKFEIQKYIDHIDLSYNPKRQELSVGKYTVIITYTNKGKNDVNNVDIIMYGDYKEIKIKDIKSNVSPIVAENENQYYTFTLEKDNLSEEEINDLKVRIYDSYDNIVYSTIESDQAEANFAFEKDEEDNYKIKIIPYKARVGEYFVTLALVGDYNYINESNHLQFTIDETYYHVKLLETSQVTTSEQINGTNDIYDFTGVKGYFDFTSDYVGDDKYSIKILNRNKVIEEIKLTPNNINGIKNIIFDAEDISNGTVEFALCINGLPYDSITRDVLEYIKITDLSIIVDNKDIDKEITLSPDDVKTFEVVVKPANATNKNPVFTVQEPKIATFNGNVITVTGDGETTIDVYTKEIQKEIKLTVYPYLKSDVYEIDNEHKTVFVNSLKSVNFLKSEFMNHLQNVSKQYKILNGDSTDVTTSTNVIGTNYKIVNGTYTYTIIVIGDVTGDGRIEMGDVTYLNRIVKGRAQPTNEAVNKAAHVLKNSNLDTGDVTKLNRFYRGRIDGI